MTDYGEGTFSQSERIDHTLKLSLGKLQTDVTKQFTDEPIDVRRTGLQNIYSKGVPEFAGDLDRYIVVDTMEGEANATPRMVAEYAQGSWRPLTVARFIQSYGAYTLGSYNNSSNYILNTNKVRDPSVAVNTTNDVVENVNVSYISQSSGNSYTTTAECFTKPSRNMFARYKYWLAGLTGCASNEANVNVTAGIIENTVNSQGTYNSNQSLSYNIQNNVQEPYSSYLTLTGSVSNPSYSATRTISQINTSIEKVRRNNSPSTADTNRYNFHQLLQQVYTGVSIINPDIYGVHSSRISGDASKYLNYISSFLKIYLNVPTYTSYLSTDSESTQKDTIVFTNPIATQSFAESDGYKNSLFAYSITGYTPTTSNHKSIGAFQGGSLIYQATTGALIYYANANFLSGNELSVKNPAFLSYVRYTGELLSNNKIVNMEVGDTLPSVATYEYEDMFLDTSANAIYIVGDGTVGKAWLQIGGGSVQTGIAGALDGDEDDTGGGTNTNTEINTHGYWRETGTNITSTQVPIEYGNLTNHLEGNVTVHSQLRSHMGFFGDNYNNLTIDDTQLQSVSGNAAVVVNGMLASRQITVTDYLDSLSDARLKTNIQPLENQLSAIQCIQPVSYDWKNKSTSREIGFIAQNVQTVFPQLVHHVHQDVSDVEKGEGSPSVKRQKFLTVNYIGFIPILCGALKEQQEQIDELKEQIQYLKRKVGK